MRVLLLFVLAASASAVALRPPSSETWRVSNASNQTGFAPNDPRSFPFRPSRDLPEKFAAKWKAEDTYVASPNHPKVTGVTEFAPHGPRIKLVIGIPVMLTALGPYEAHLQTWVTGKGVCHLQHHDQPNCSIFPVFLVGNSTASKAVAGNASKFALSLPVPEPTTDIDDGFWEEGMGPARKLNKDADVIQFAKPYFWFKFASENYKWATHLGKMDVDTYPHFSAILNDIANGPSDTLYWGAHMGPGLEDCSSGFMQGAMYIISAALQPCMQPVVVNRCPEESVNFDTWEICGKSHWLEDIYFGNCLFEAVGRGKCPHVTCMDSRLSDRYTHPCCQ